MSLDARKRAEDVAGRLNGTCDGLTDDELEDQEMLLELDNLIWMCECCGWWVEVHETNDNGICEDCRDEEED